jgi:hypothetical protein
MQIDDSVLVFGTAIWWFSFILIQADQDLLDHKDQEDTKGAEGTPDHLVQPDLRDCQVTKTFSLYFYTKKSSCSYEKWSVRLLHAKMLTQLSEYGTEVEWTFLMSASMK